MSTPLQCTQIEVEHLRGIERPGFRLEKVSEGINLIYGPNASGKSTLAVALRRLLWPEELVQGDEELYADFECGGRAWSVDLERGRVTVRGERPEEMPGAARRPRYHLYLHELLDATNSSFADQIQREAMGGYDVPGAAEALGFEEVRPIRGKTAESVEQARAQLDEAMRAQRELRRREDRLGRLESDLETATRADRQVDALNAAVEIRRVDLEIESVERDLEAFDDRHRKLGGDEAKRAQEIREARADARRQKEDAAESVEACDRALDGLTLPKDGVAEEELEEAEARLNRLSESRREVEQLREQRAQLETRCRRLSERFGDIVDAQRAANVRIEDHSLLEEFLSEFQQQNAQRRARRVFRETFHRESAPGASAIAARREAAGRLRRWLSARAYADVIGSTRQTSWWLAMTAATLAVAAGGAIGAWWHWAGWLIAGAALVVGGWAWRARPSETSEESRPGPDVIARRYDRQVELPAPEAWTVDEVEAHLRQLESATADHVVARAFEQTWSAYKTSFDVDEQRLASLRRKVREALGVVPDAGEQTSVSLVRTVDHLERYQRHCDELAGVKAGLDEREDQFGEAFDSLGQLLVRWGLDEPSSPEAAEAGVARVRELESRRRELTSELEQAKETLSAAEESERKANRQLASLYAELELEAGNRERLEALCRRHDEWESLRSRVEDLRRERDILVRQYRDRYAEVSFDDDRVPEVPWEAGVSELQAAIEDAEARAERTSELRESISTTRHDMDRARASSDVERARARLARRRRELADERRGDYEKRVGDALAGFVHRQTRDRELPDVFHRARKLFAEVTRGAYRLELQDDREPAFRAYDTVEQRRQSLESLSSGTRLQLLLAVRMAFTERDERGVAVPLVFDETLANSDDTRAKALVHAIGDIAARGRQVFYLTAQSDEIRKFRAVCEQTDRFDYQLHRLRTDSTAGGENDRAGRTVTSSAREDWGDHIDLPEVVSSEQVPEPAGSSHASYGETLHVARWHPRDPVGSLHLWYIVEDVDLLYRMLSAGVRSWGHLRMLDEVGAGHIVSVTPEGYERIGARARVVESFADAWKQGRGAPVDRATLKASGAVSDNFIDEVAALCQACDGDAAAIIEHLEDGAVKRFRSAKIAELRQFFVEEGHLVDDEPLGDRALLMQVLASVSDAIRDGLLDRETVDRVIQRVSGR